jgi:hypothetical protein
VHGRHIRTGARIMADVAIDDVAAAFSGYKPDGNNAVVTNTGDVFSGGNNTTANKSNTATADVVADEYDVYDHETEDPNVYTFTGVYGRSTWETSGNRKRRLRIVTFVGTLFALILVLYFYSPWSPLRDRVSEATQRIAVTPHLPPPLPPPPPSDGSSGAAHATPARPRADGDATTIIGGADVSAATTATTAGTGIDDVAAAGTDAIAGKVAQTGETSNR